MVCDDVLDSNQTSIDPFFTKRRINDLDVYYLSTFILNHLKKQIEKKVEKKCFVQKP